MTHTGPGHARTAGRLAALLLLAVAPAAGAQQGAAVPAAAGAARALSLDDAVRLAQERSEEITIARAGVTRARGQVVQARSQFLPQLGGSIAYTKTLKSQFSALSGGGSTDSASQGPPPPPSLCAPRIPENATPEQRAAALAQAVTCPESGGFGRIDFSRVGFGARNQWVGGLQLSQNLFTGGRITAGYRAAEAGERAAALGLAQQRAALALEVTQAYFDAALADRMVAIADSTLEQTEDVLRQTSVARRVGNQSEFELLRAQVSRDNQRPVVIQARSSREVAYLRLKQMLDIPLDADVRLTTPIDDAAAPAAVPAVLAAARLLPAGDAAALADTSVLARAVVRQTDEALRAQEQLLRITRSQRFPTISLTSGYQRLYFPTSTFPNLGQFSENWTVGVSAGLSLFDGGRVRGEALVARANVDEARARLQQVRELAALDARVAIDALQQADAAWAASQGTVEQAQRAYRIDQIRFREGLATQTDLSQTRILVQQAAANRALAARDLAVARMRLALLRDLPLQLGGGSAGGAGGAGGAGQSQTQQQPQQSQPQQQRPSTQQTQAAGGQSAARAGGAP